jgi:hypothetical protein
MANAAKNAILRALIEGVITDLMVKTKVDNVYVDDSTTLAAKLSEIITSLNAKTTMTEVNTALNTALGSYATTSAMNKAVNDAISNLINGAPAAYDTLKELADGISENGDLVETMTAAIGNKADKTTVEAIQATVDALGSLARKSIVTESDLDASLKEKVNAASEGNHSHNNKELLDSYTQSNSDLADAVSKKHSHSNKAVLDGITADNVSAWGAKSKVYYQASQPSSMTANDLWVQIVQ